MLAALAASAVWGICGSAFGFSSRGGYLAAYLFADTLRYGCWFAFLLLLIWPREATASRPKVLAGVAIATIAGGLLLQGLAQLLSGAGGEFAYWVRLHLLASVVVALVLLEQLFRNVSEDTRWSVKPICLGLGCAFAFDFYMYAEAVLFNRIDSDVLSIRGLVHVMVIPLLAVSNVRSKGWLARIQLSRKLAFHSAALLLAGVYLLFVAGVGYYVRSFGGDWGRALQLALLFAGVLLLGMLLLSGSMRAALRQSLGKHFFRYRYDYREEWLRFTRLLSERGSPEAVGQHVIRALADMVESPAGALWLKDAQHLTFIQSARWNMPVMPAVDPGSMALCEFVAGNALILNLDEFRAHPERYGHIELPVWLAQIPHAWLLVPLLSGKEMTGFVVLAEARATTEVNWEVNDLLRTASCQAASFLAQIQATDALLEAEKFDSFNRMSAFVVHDLKNIVTQLALMLRNAERHRENPEFQTDMLMTVGNSIERMRQLMLQLQQGGQAADAPSGVDLATVVNRIEASKRDQGIPFKAAIAARPIARGHEDRLERVIGHIVQNGIDATAKGGEVRLELHCKEGEAVIEIKDSGEGMAPDFVRQRLFKPFQTTKVSGMGVGAYESAEYVRELGGRIAVQSELGTGTTITIFLPLFGRGEGKNNAS